MGQEKAVKRYHRIDEIRGFILLNMIIFHTFWDLVYMYGAKADWYRGTIGILWQRCICFGFIFLSGFCWQLGKKPWKRGMLVFGAGLLITLSTMLVMPDNLVLFGILTFLGSAMLLFIPLSRLLDKIPPIWGILGSFLFFLFTYSVNHGYVGIGTIKLWTLPRAWYGNLFTGYMGFPEPGFRSMDYFSIFPWIFLYMAGYFAYSLWKKKGKVSVENKRVAPVLEFLGKHSLLIYMLHQPLIYGICMLVFGY